MKENCDNCNTDYEYVAESCTLNLFIEDPDCNHVETKCPHCGTVERVYCHADAFLHVMNQLGAGVSLHPRATDDLKRKASTAWQGHEEQSVVEEVEAPSDLPEAPKEMVRQLYDDLRNWRGEAL